MIEFKVITDTVTYEPPSEREWRRYEEMMTEHEYYIRAPLPRGKTTPVTETMSEMVADGWQVHTFSKDANGVHYALMEREVPDAD